ncbi:MAG TPA: TMEM175 family protein [Ktedonobacteraceae bacterium]|nr:TMEM175 family protein [Ktedonobacteraceae bacterium]
MEDKETSRLEAFSDGVFAVAITLLVLNIKVPGLENPGNLLADRDLWAALGNQWPMLVAYVISFATTGIMWLNHHRLFTLIKRTDTPLLFLNLLLLLFIVFIPVPTALLADYLTRPDLHTAAILYSGTFFIAACCFNVLWLYASYHNRLLSRDTDPHAVADISKQYLFGPICYFAMLVLAWINVPACIILGFLLALFFAFPGHTLHSLLQKRS